jgi:hypothetical protein
MNRRSFLAGIRNFAIGYSALLNPNIKFEYGCSRMVILIYEYAIKLPNLKYRYPSCLWGLIHNLNERNWWRASMGDFDVDIPHPYNKLLCPIIYSNRFGLIIIMKRATPLPKSFDCPILYEYLAQRFLKLGDCICPAERKIDSFGLLDNEIVAVDYA